MQRSIEIKMDRRSRKFVIIASVFLILAGILGITLPQVMSIAVTALIGWLLLLAGAIVFYLTWHGFRQRGTAWLKPFALIATGLLVIFYPVAGAAALGLMLAVYFLMSGFAGVSFAWELRPHKGWGWLMLSGVLSFLLAVIFLVGWPFASMWMVGMFVGISLLFDGAGLLVLGLAAKEST